MNQPGPTTAKADATRKRSPSASPYVGRSKAGKSATKIDNHTLASGVAVAAGDLAALRMLMESGLSRIELTAFTLIQVNGMDPMTAAGVMRMPIMRVNDVVRSVKNRLRMAQVNFDRLNARTDRGVARRLKCFGCGAFTVLRTNDVQVCGQCGEAM